MMKGKRAIFLSAVLVCSLGAGSLFAQESDDPVLQKARDKYQEQLDKGSTEDSQTNRPEAASEVPYEPVLLSFVPGVSIPFGYYRTSASLAAIGAIFEASYGFAGAGIFNIYNDGYGFQGAGVFNIAGSEINGFQGAGVFNIAGGPVRGAQLAGVFNIAERVQGGVQGAGVFNIASRVNGVQYAGVFNIADSVNGVQIGLVNITGELQGLQLGLINISNNGVDSLSYVYMPAVDTSFVYWQAGSPFLYMVVGAGAPRKDWFVRNDRLMISAGLGTRVRLGGPYIDVDVSAEQAIGSDIEALYQAVQDEDKERFLAYLNPYPSARLSLGLPLGRNLHLTGGVKVLVQLEQGGTVPEEQKTQDTLSAAWFGLPFTAWSQWFLGCKVRLHF
jgi:hypothetical protein